MLNVDEYLLTCLSEECAECAKEADKTLRFGPEGFDPTDPDKLHNVDRLIEEYYHIRAVMEMLEDEGFLTLHDHPDDLKIIEFKKRKVRRYMEVSSKLGVLNTERNENRIPRAKGAKRG